MINNKDTANYLMWKLRDAITSGNLTDYNAASRTGTNFIYGDKPLLTSLLANKQNFPRVAITNMDESTLRSMGLQCTQHHDLTQAARNIYAPNNLICEINNVATETHNYVTGTDTYTLDSQPASIIGATIDGTLTGAPHSFVKDTDYELTFGLEDKVKWLGVDEPDNGTSFTCGYSRKASGANLVQIIGRDIKALIREQWRAWFVTDKRLTDFKIISSKPVTLDEFTQLERYEIYVTAKGINLDE